MDWRELNTLFNLLEATTGPYGDRGREMIVACIESPTVETWEDVQAFVLVREPLINFACAVRAVDPSFETPVYLNRRNGTRDWAWQQPPSSDTLIEALKYAAYRWH